MEAYDLAHKLAYAGKHSPVPFTTGPEWTNSVPGVPVLAMLRIFLSAEDWSEENIMKVAREMSRILGPTEQFDIGITRADIAVYDADSSAFGRAARLMKLDPNDPQVILRLTDGDEDKLYKARFPALRFEAAGEDLWESHFAPMAMKPASQP